MQCNDILPWQGSLWEHVVSLVRENRLPHALLFSGQKGIGKKHFALSFAKALLCPQFHQSLTSCFQGKLCHACELTHADTHPDLLKVEPDNQAIKIDQIRSVIQFANHTALLEGYKVIIVYASETMNHYAANALLKILEEPPSKTVFILLSDTTMLLPATIRSRCQKILFKPPTLNESSDWLKTQINHDSIQTLLRITQGAPLETLSLIEQENHLLRKEFLDGFYQLTIHQISPLELAAKWYEHSLSLLIEFLFSWIRDMVSFKLTQESNVLINQDYQSILSRMSQKLSFAHLLGYSDHIQKIVSLRQEGFNLNSRLLLEELFIKWTNYDFAC